MKILEHNVETGEAIERNATKAELDEITLENAAKAAEDSQAQTKATAKAALLEKLGITADEAKLLLA
jgi:hypothetical protein